MSGAFLIAAVGLAMVLGCGKLAELGNKVANTRTEDESRVFTLAGKEWTSFDLAQTDIRAELPGRPKDETPPISPNIKQVFSAMHIWSYDDKDFGSSFSQLVPTAKRQFKIKELADTSMGAIKKQAPDLTYTLDIRSDTNAKYNGMFTKNGKTYDLRGCCIYKIGRDARVWAVITLSPQGNADAQSASDRIIGSVVFADSSERCK